MALQLVHPIKGSASGLVQLAQIRITYNKTINFITFTYKSTHHRTNKKPHEGEAKTHLISI